MTGAKSQHLLKIAVFTVIVIYFAALIMTALVAVQCGLSCNSGCEYVSGIRHFIAQASCLSVNLKYDNFQ